MLSLLALLQATSLDDLLQKGEVNLLETAPDGRLQQVTTIALLKAPIQQIWDLLADFEAYETWMPQVSDAAVVSSENNVVVVDWKIGVVGPDVGFRGRYTLDPSHWTINGQWESGALPGSFWNWKLEPAE